MMVKELFKNYQNMNKEAHDHANDIYVIDNFLSSYLKIQTKCVKMKQNERYDSPFILIHFFFIFQVWVGFLWGISMTKEWML